MSSFPRLSYFTLPHAKTKMVAGALLAAFLQGTATAQQFVPIDPWRTYLRTVQDPDSNDSFPIDLAFIQAGPGCILQLERAGEFAYNSNGDTLTAMMVVFTNGSTLLPNPPEDDQSCFNRVPGALDTGLPDFPNPRTLFGQLCTEVPNDFVVDNDIVVVTVPENATHMFVSAIDEHYGDNSDDDTDYGLIVTNLTPTVFITEDTYISDGDTSIDGAKLFVQGATLTIDGTHLFQSINVLSGGNITHTQGFDNGVIQGFELVTVEDITVDLGGSISVTSRGYLGDEGPGAGTAGANYSGGGGHGGEGGRGANRAASEGGISYGSITEPTEFGSGGAQDIDDLIPGCRGGGTIRLDIGGVLTVNGFIDAVGESTGTAAGAGAGGSIWINAGAVTGTTGEIRVYGGYNSYNGGGGSGGRIAIYADSITLDDERFQAYGGYGWWSGESGGDAAAGTVYIAEAGSTPTLIIDNDNVSTEPRLTTLRAPLMLDANLIVRDSARFGAPQGMSFDAAFTGDVEVKVGASINVNSRGYLGDDGPGAGTAGANYSGGGGHGGEGGRGANNADSEGGISYGSITEPTEFGSGGAQDIDDLIPGKRGGGAIRLDVGGTLTVNGFIDAVGESTGNAAGAGAGGSIWINAGAVIGTTGELRVDGGDNTNNGGGGSGGRIAIYADSVTLDDERLQATGGVGWWSGESGGDAAAGTIYIAETGSTPTLIIDNDNVSTEPRLTTLRAPLVLDANLIVRDSARFGAPQGMPFDAAFTGDVEIKVGASINANARGYDGDEGPGAGTAGANYGGGGGHGGEGGRGANGAASEGGISYGSITEPTEFGSGGAQDIDDLIPGKRGGGAIRLDVGGTLTVNGFIDAVGESTGNAAGAGAGGSIWINAGAVIGTTGELRVDGGDNTNNGGGGSGGRIAIYADSVTLDDERLQATGGVGWWSGESGGDAAAGTIYIAETGSTPTLIIDNDAVSPSARITMLPPDQIITGDVIVRDKARLGVERGLGAVAWHIAGDLSVESGSDIYAAYRGYGAEDGPGAGEPGLLWGGGGGHGGHGGDGRSDDPYALGGFAYGSDLFPVTIGSGGARDPNTGAGGGAGGGALWIRVDGELSLRGNIYADGAGGGADEAGGGAGGSILIEATTVSGIATITAPGGIGNSAGGGGGGGRIAVYTCDLDPRLQIKVEKGGSGSGGTGSDGTIILDGGAIIDDPESQQLDLGDDAIFDTFALGPNLAYQWNKDGNPLQDGPTGHGSVISGSTTPTLTITTLTAEDFGSYTVAVSNSCVSLLSQPGVLSSTCPADFNGDGIVNSQDFIAFLSAWANGDPVADFNGDGVIDTRDFVAFLGEWAAGC